MSDRCPTCGGRYVTWTPARIIEACRGWAESHGGQPPSGDDWHHARPEHPSSNGAIRQFGSWNAMIAAAGFTPRKQGGNRRWTREAAMAALTPWVFEHGRLPKRKEWRSPANGRPTSSQVEGLFGTWNGYIIASGYEPSKAYRQISESRRAALRAHTANRPRDERGRLLAS